MYDCWFSCCQLSPRTTNRKRDKSALRKFANRATRALATLTSMNCLPEINQGNIVSMEARLPKPLQDKFAALAYDLEAKAQRFPTLANFVNFLTRHSNIANHPISGKSQQFSYNNPIKNRKVLSSGKLQPPKCTTMSINSKTTPRHLRKTEGPVRIAVAAAAKRIRCTDAKSSRQRHRKRERPLSPQRNCVLIVSRALSIQQTPAPVPLGARFKGVVHSTTLSFTQRNFT